MKVFVSHSSKDADVAERLALALQHDEHDVFFDRHSLDPSDEYNRRIRDEIAACDLFVFLASKASLREDSYARSELEIAKQRFVRPSGRVLPVMLEKIPPSELPPFLAAVTLFDPVGDVVAETAHEVERIARRRNARRLRWLAVCGIAVLGVTASVVAWRLRAPPTEPAGIRISAVELARSRRDFDARADVYRLTANVVNGGSATQTVVRLDVEADPSDVVAQYDSASQVVLATWRDAVLLPGQAKTLELELTFCRRDGSSVTRGLYEPELGEHRWRLSLPVHGAAAVATTWRDFRAHGVFAHGTLQPLASSIRERVRFVAQGDQTPRDSIAFTTVDPPELWEMDASGKLRRVAALDAEPTALAAGGDCIAVGAAGSLRLFVGPTAEPQGPYSIHAVAVSDEPSDARAYSNVPRSLAIRIVEESDAAGDGSRPRVATDLEVWMRTQDAEAPPFLLRFSSMHETLTAPFAAGWASARASASELANELGLRVIDGDVYGATSAWGPGRIVKMWDGDFLVTDGREESLVACAWDVAPAPGGGMLVLDCDRALARARSMQGTIVPVQSVAALPLPKTEATARETQRISVCGGRALIAINRFSLQPPESGTHLFTWTVAGGARLVAAVDRCETVGLATLVESGCAVLRMANGEHQAVRFDYDGP
ncbi:MAG: toll/interleukin-1 receptor domain-containing protein [Planctomycetota bacterium]